MEMLSGRFAALAHIVGDVLEGELDADGIALGLGIGVGLHADGLGDALPHIQMIEVEGIGRAGDREALRGGDLHHDVVQIVLCAGVFKGEVQIDDLTGQKPAWHHSCTR